MIKYSKRPNMFKIVIMALEDEHLFYDKFSEHIQNCHYKYNAIIWSKFDGQTLPCC